MNREPKIDNSSTNPAPAMEWKPIVETLDELRGMSPVRCVLAYFPHTKNTAVVEAGAAVEYHTHDAWGGAAWMLLPAPPKPTPTVEELERAVVEAAIAVHAFRNSIDGGQASVWREFDERIDALLAHRARAKNNSGDAAGVK